MKPLLKTVRGTVVTCLAIACVSESLAEQDPIIVTATRTAGSADQTLASVTVITREDIERRQARSVQELLRGQAGINVSNNGGPGKPTTVFIRGAESDQTLVLIDGVKVGSASLGTFPFENIPPEQIERIEIVRGPRSSLYGSEAVGGVIQIFTRKGGGPAAPTFSAGMGSHSSKRVSAGLSNGTGNAWYNVNLAYEDTNGFNACTGDPVTFAGCATIEPDSDGYTNRSGSLAGGFRLPNNAELQANFLRTKGDVDFDGSFVNETDTILQVATVKLKYAPAEFWDTSLEVGQTRDESNNFKDEVFQTTFDTKRYTASLQNDFVVFEQGVFTLGGDYQLDEVSGTTQYAEDSRNNKGVFAQYQTVYSGFDVLGSVRHDDNEQFGTETTGNIAAGYTFARGIRVMAAYGTAFKAPTFNDLYFPNFGNPGLDPEESESFEIGVSHAHSWGNASLNAFYTDIDDLIAGVFDPGFPPFFFRAANVDKVRIRGLEAQVNAAVGNWLIDIAGTYMDPENRGDGANRGNQLARRPKRSFRMDIAREINQWSIGGTLLAESRRYDDLANTRKIGSYYTVDLRAGYKFLENWSLEGSFNNIFDETYETASFYKQDGRNFFVSVRYGGAN